MSDKPKVYQGVRVKTTVKELLQRRRAEQAANETVKTISQELARPEVCVSAVPAHYYDSFPGEASAHRSLQPRQFPGTAGTVPMESMFESQLMSLLLPDDSFSQGPLPPPPSAQAWAHGHQSIDYYGHEMAPSSPPDSLNLPSPADYNSYSPQESYSSSSSSSCYSSPSRLDSGYGYVPEHYHYQNCSLQHCYCLSPWGTGPQDSLPTQDYTAYGHTDCAYASPVHESFFRRDWTSQEMCYL